MSQDLLQTSKDIGFQGSFLKKTSMEMGDHCDTASIFQLRSQLKTGAISLSRFPSQCSNIGIGRYRKTISKSAKFKIIISCISDDIWSVNIFGRVVEDIMGKSAFFLMKQMVLKLYRYHVGVYSYSDFDSSWLKLCIILSCSYSNSRRKFQFPRLNSNFGTPQ